MQNPYESPRGVEAKITWNERVRRFFARVSPSSNMERFLSGERMFHYGVIFRVDPKDSAKFFAGLPLAVDDEEHVRRNVDEAVRVLGELLKIYPELFAALCGRALDVAMLDSYQSSEIIRSQLVPSGQWEAKIAVSL